MEPLKFRFEKWRITEMKNGEIFKTEKVGEAWFACAQYKRPSEFPETNVWDENDECWVATGDMK